MVRSLATRFDAPIFEPHVTLYSGPLGSTDQPDKIIREAAQSVSEIFLHVTGINHSEQFTKSLFIEFATNDALTKLSEALKRRSSQPIDYVLKPHLSLIYASLATETRQRLVNEFSVLSQVVRFDAVKAMVNAGPTRTRKDFETWRIVASARLTG